MLYRMLRATNLAFPFVLLWVYVGVFALALPFMFIFPPISLVLVLVAALSVPVVFIVRTLMMMPQKMLARSSLHAGTCPRCGEFVVDSTAAQDARWHCVSCGTLFAEDGEEIELPGSGSGVEGDQQARLAT